MSARLLNAASNALRATKPLAALHIEAKELVIGPIRGCPCWWCELAHAIAAEENPRADWKPEAGRRAQVARRKKATRRR